MPRFDVETLKSVFAYHMVERIVAADANLDGSELAYLEQLFPVEELISAGFSDEDGALTPLFLEARDESLRFLPDALPLADKLRLISTFMQACLVDGELHASEGTLLYDAALSLGVSPSEFNRHLDSLTETVANIELPEPEPT